MTNKELLAKLKRKEGLIDWQKEQMANSAVLIESGRKKLKDLQRVVIEYMGARSSCGLLGVYSPTAGKLEHQAGVCKSCPVQELCPALKNSEA